MARMAYNVNNQIKLLDIHKQFNGGLKTVDTDDALNDFFLRQAENVSISEFGFLEKRYGLSKKRQLVLHDGTSEVIPSGTIQGHFKYNYGANTDEFIAIGGKLYLKEDGDAVFTVVSSFAKQTGFKYPTDTEFSNAGLDYSAGTFQTTREVGFVRIEEVLYIFTGTYPLIYSGGGTVYLMPYFVPNFNEIASLAQGVNLLVSDFEDVYGYNDLDLSTEDSVITQIGFGSYGTITEKEATYAPLIPSVSLPYTTGGQTASQVDFQVAMDADLAVDLTRNFTGFIQNYTYRYVSQGTTPIFPYTDTFSDPAGAACSPYSTALRYVSNNNYYTCELDPLYNNGFFTQIAPISVEYRAAGGIVWDEVPAEKVVLRQFYANTQGANFSTGTAVVPDTYANYFLDEYRELNYEPVFIDYNSYHPLDKDQAKNPLKISLRGFEVGNYDFRITYRLTASFIQQTGATTYSLIHLPLSEFSTNFENITITSVRISLEDYEVPRALWSVNQAIAHYDKILAWGSVEAPETLFISDPEYKNWFPATATVYFDTDEDEPIQAVTPFMQVLVVQSATKTWGLKGSQIVVSEETAGDIYEVFPISPIYGTIAPKSVRPVRNRLYFLSREGVVELNSLYAVDFRYNVGELDRNIQNIVPKDVGAIGIQHDYQYWLHFPSTKATFRYYIDKKAWVKDTYDFAPNSEFDQFEGIHKFVSKDGILTFLTQPARLDEANNGIFELEVDKSLPSDLGNSFKSTFETAFLNQTHPFHPKKYLETKLDFTIQNEYNLGTDAIPKSNVVEEAAYAQFSAPLLRNHTYQLGLIADYAITDVQYIADGGTPTSCFVNYNSTEFIVSFRIPYVEFTTLEIKLIGTNIVLTDSVLKDITYDHTINFNTWMISEEGTLNLDNITSYDEEQAEIPINLGTVFGENEVWVFDESAFNDRITAVKTVKLSGRGYNFKLYFTDRSKSKWTLESIGIAYKFKRARSR